MRKGAERGGVKTAQVESSSSWCQEHGLMWGKRKETFVRDAVSKLGFFVPNEIALT